MTKVTITAEERLGEYQSELAQRDGQIVVLEERNRDLSGYQKEAIDLRDSVASLTAKLEQETARADAAERDAKIANGAATSNAAIISADAGLLEHAKNLAAAVKAFS